MVWEVTGLGPLVWNLGRQPLGAQSVGGYVSGRPRGIWKLGNYTGSLWSRGPLGLGGHKVWEVTGLGPPIWNLGNQSLGAWSLGGH